MEALVLTLFVSLIFVGLAIGFLVWMVRQGTHEHHERMGLLPLPDDREDTE